MNSIKHWKIQEYFFIKNFKRAARIRAIIFKNFFSNKISLKSDGFPIPEKIRYFK